MQVEALEKIKVERDMLQQYLNKVDEKYWAFFKKQIKSQHNVQP
jgi:hypothetical protein